MQINLIGMFQLFWQSDNEICLSLYPTLTILDGIIVHNRIRPPPSSNILSFCPINGSVPIHTAGGGESHFTEKSTACLKSRAGLEGPAHKATAPLTLRQTSLTLPLEIVFGYKIYDQ